MDAPPNEACASTNEDFELQKYLKIVKILLNLEETLVTDSICDLIDLLYLLLKPLIDKSLRQKRKTISILSRVKLLRTMCVVLENSVKGKGRNPLEQ